MSDRLARFSKWAEEQADMSGYLSKKENWTPMLKMVSRQFLVIGTVLGMLFGCYAGWIIWGWH